MNQQDKKVRLFSINLSRTWRDDALEGLARFSMKDGEHATKLTIRLNAEQIDAIVKVCAESVVTLAKQQAEMFHRDAAEITSNLLEHKK